MGRWGKNLKSLLHLVDVARACSAVISSPMNGTNIYNVSVPAIKMKDIVETVALALGKSAPSWHIPASLALNAANALKYLSFNTGRIRSIYATLQKWLADDYCLTDKFYKTYNFQAKVNIEEGITREIA